MTDRSKDKALMGDAWDRFLARAHPEIGFMQSSWWANFLARRGWGHFGAIFQDGDEVLGGARVLTNSFAPGKSYFYIPDGPVLPVDEADAKQLFDAVLSFVDRKRRQETSLVSHLRLEPRWTVRPGFVKGCREAGSWLEPRRTLCIDLTVPKPALLAQMAAKGRYNIGLAIRHGVSVVEDRTAAGLQDLMAIIDETNARQRIRGKTPDFFEALLAALVEGDHGSLFFAEYEGLRIAALLVIYHGDTATYFFGGSRSVHRNVMAPYLLHFEVMLRAQSRGLRWYDLYGIAPVEDKDHRWANISVFKRKFGGQEMIFGPALDFIYDQQGYEAYRSYRSGQS